MWRSQIQGGDPPAESLRGVVPHLRQQEGHAAPAGAPLRQLGVTAPGATMVLAGGVVAAGALALCGLLVWTLSRPEVTADGSLVRALYFLVFLTGGPGHVVVLGLLVAGVAVP